MPGEFRLLRAHEEGVVPLEDVEKQTEMIMKSGQMGVPVIDIDGTIIIGFDVDKIRKMLKI